MPAPFPIEMLAEIARHAGESRDRKSIQQCTLVSRAFRGVFEPWMYNTPAFGNAEPTAGSVADPTWGDWNVENTSHLLDTMSARPSLGCHTTAVVVGVAASLDDEHLPKLLTLLPLVKFFTLFALGQNWSCLGTETQRAAIRMCQSSTLVIYS
ncbi:hypothetical protein FA13DRAFT_1409961 [Coprinellus micaceus]|uniref:F-box domain-containing protein n=1 Tax=Coprinellus micaceus TaxID=71717 RepID=A0A4Y7SNN9_COPMI|nr:hypothetical protein FA13DRAFT_1409961 [Coprinellus micaceus]